MTEETEVKETSNEEAQFNAKKQIAMEALGSLQSKYLTAIASHESTGNEAADSIQKLGIQQVALKIGEVFRIVANDTYVEVRDDEEAKK